MVAVVVALAVVSVLVVCVSLWVNEGPMWRWVILETRFLQYEVGEDSIEGYSTWRRWGRYAGHKHGHEVHYFASNGYMKFVNMFRNGAWLSHTEWREDGTVKRQFRTLPDGSSELRNSPPWWETPQTEPTAPWWNDDE